jgi:hypothetical protein
MSKYPAQEFQDLAEDNTPLADQNSQRSLKGDNKDKTEVINHIRKNSKLQISSPSSIRKEKTGK